MYPQLARWVVRSTDCSGNPAKPWLKSTTGKCRPVAGSAPGWASTSYATRRSAGIFAWRSGRSRLAMSKVSVGWSAAVSGGRIPDDHPPAVVEGDA